MLFSTFKRLAITSTLVGAIAISLSATGAYAYKPTAEDKTSFQQWLSNFKKRATLEGIQAPVVDNAFSGLKISDTAIRLDRNQTHTKLTFAEYQKRVLPQSRVDSARARLAKHRTLLHKIGKEYGVQPRFIVALWAVESDFGRQQGNFGVVKALATLAWEGRRAEFFSKELINALTILQQGHITNAKFTGSWAGAMGQCQFMPSSFLAFAQDYNGDGRKDIWNTKADVFASIANYLSQSGWDSSQTWGREVTGASGINGGINGKFEVGRESGLPLARWSSYGVTQVNGTPLPTVDISAKLVEPVRANGKQYLTYGNYDVLKKWNRSDYFALTVSKLADTLR